MRRRGYIIVTNDGRPYEFALSRKGREHCRDPFVQKKRKQESLQHRVSAILNDDDRFKEALETELQNRMNGTPSILSGGHGGSVSAPASSLNENEVIKVIRSKDEEISKLQCQLQEMKRQAQGPTTPVSTGPQRQRTPEQVKEERLLVRRRKKLATVYTSTNRFLDMNFFAKWDGNFPYRMKHSQWYKPGSVEILSEKNPEVRARDHVTGKLPPDFILAHQFKITHFGKNSITVEGRGLREKCTMRF
ncbi:hypothetical protein [uncultured Methanolobus sp.]|uniref:hypothetical protein n=1 Tax=uncultured Methanolobus sp. TaxID=218300 RepID=UPI0029C624F8|nr:hypothetical protein [uncultured Methanolobus sp.]